jgi:hypothetical protein
MLRETGCCARLNLAQDLRDGADIRRCGAWSVAGGNSTREGKPADMLTHRFNEAFAFAHDLHRRQTRNGTTIPYVSHLMGVQPLSSKMVAARIRRSVRFCMTRPKIRAANGYWPKSAPASARRSPTS